jgi:hypothetical protein
MKRYSANQGELFDLSEAMPTTGVGTSARFFAEAAEMGTTVAASEQGSATSEIEFPEFGAYTGTRAETVRIAGRMVAAQASEAEQQAFLGERQELLNKLFAKTLTRREEIRLEYVRWSLDRIEDAKHGSDLDRIEDSIGRYESFLEELEQFKAALNRASKARR